MPETQIDAVKHDETRPNILTPELSNFDAEHEPQMEGIEP